MANLAPMALSCYSVRLMGYWTPPALQLKCGCLRYDGPNREERQMVQVLHEIWSDQSGQDIAEYAVMLAVILVIVVGTVKLIGGKSNNIFSEVASSIQ